MQSISCEGCGQQTPPFDIVHFGPTDGKYRDICGRCFNTHVASLVGLDDFEHVRLDPISMIDISGTAHEFHFRTHLFGSGVTLDAFELADGVPSGYQFRVMGEPDDDLWQLMARLVEKMRRALALQHIENTPLGVHVTDRNVVRGRVESSDAENDWDLNIPTVVIDGREVSWADFGRMLAAYEGWQFKLEMVDLSDEV